MYASRSSCRGKCLGGPQAELYDHEVEGEVGQQQYADLASDVQTRRRSRNWTSAATAAISRNASAMAALTREKTHRAQGGTVLALLTETSRHPKLGDAVVTLMPNLKRATRIVAAHQERGPIGPSDPHRTSPC